MSEHEIDEDHGHSIAAWTGVLVILVGSALASLAVAISNVPLFVVGIVICILGVIAGKLLSMAGYGTKTVNAVDTPDSNRPEVGIG
jgi:multisubunit Na+/H+ antiporter MnhG subunit